MRIQLSQIIEESRERVWDNQGVETFWVSNKTGLDPSTRKVSDDLSNYKLIKKNYLAYNPYRVNVWSIWLFNKKLGAVSPAYVVFKIDESKLYPELLLHFLKSSKGLFEINQHTHWWVRKVLSFRELGEIEINLPDMIFQEKFIAWMKKQSTNFDTLWYIGKDNQSLVSKLRQSILQDAIEWKLVLQDSNDEPASELLKRIKIEKEQLIVEKKIKKPKVLAPITEDEKNFELPKGWEWCRLGDIVITNPRNHIDNCLDTSFIPMKLIEDWYSNKHSFEKKKWEEIKSWFTHFKERDVVFAKITPCFQNRKSAIMNWLINEFWAGTTELIVLRSYNELVLPELLLLFVKSRYFIDLWVSTYTWTAWQQRVNKDKLLNSSFLLPPLAEQKRIVAKVDELMKLCDLLEKEIIESKENWEKLMESVLSEVFK